VTTDYQSRLRTLVANKAKGGFRVAAKDEATKAEIYLYEEIDATDFCGVSARTFVKQLNATDADEITLYINSPGGDAFEGIAIMNALRRHKARVTTVVDGLAASAASFIAMAGDEVVMSLGSELMIHDAWGLCVGNADDMSEIAARLEKLSGDLAGIYAEHAGGTAAEWRDAMRAETWYTAEEAVEAGLATRVETARGNEPAEQAKAKFDLSVFAHAGRAAARAPFIPAARAALKPPAAEPVESVPPTEEVIVAEATDTLREGLRQRLGVTDAEASDEVLLAAYDEHQAEVMASLDEATVKAETKPAGPDLHAEITRLSAELAEVHAREARAEKLAFFDSAMSQGRIKPAERTEIEAMYDKAPDETKAFVLARAPGSAVPVAAIGHDGGTDDGRSRSDVEYEALWGKKEARNG
jgi:ATP-dependent Clp endopeptidase proteolytic subunit ClpP